MPAALVLKLRFRIGSGGLSPRAALLHAATVREIDRADEFRAEHGPIQDVDQLAKILGAGPVAEAIGERVAFDPADSTAPEAPGA